MTKREPIAIIGMGCRYPGDANTPEEFWDLIIEKKDDKGRFDFRYKTLIECVK